MAPFSPLGAEPEAKLRPVQWDALIQEIPHSKPESQYLWFYVTLSDVHLCEL